VKSAEKKKKKLGQTIFVTLNTNPKKLSNECPNGKMQFFPNIKRAFSLYQKRRRRRRRRTMTK